MNSNGFENTPDLKMWPPTTADSEHFTKLLAKTSAITEATVESQGIGYGDVPVVPSQPEDDLAADDPIPKPDLSLANFHLGEPVTRRIIVADAGLGASWEQLKTGD